VTLFEVAAPSTRTPWPALPEMKVARSIRPAGTDPIVVRAVPEKYAVQSVSQVRRSHIVGSNKVPFHRGLGGRAGDHDAATRIVVNRVCPNCGFPRQNTPDPIAGRFEESGLRADHQVPLDCVSDRRLAVAAVHGDAVAAVAGNDVAVARVRPPTKLPEAPSIHTPYWPLPTSGEPAASVPM